MAKTLSTMLPLGTLAPDFALPDTDGKIIKRDDFRGKSGLLVMFICNHCPFVKHVAAQLAELGRDFTSRGLGIVAINANDAQAYPDDSPAKMREEKSLRQYQFPYLFDETQAVATAYQAACTPDFYLFDRQFVLVYRGQLDASRPGNALPVDGKDLRAAIEAVLAGQKPSLEQIPSIGCNIKWRGGKQPF